MTLYMTEKQKKNTIFNCSMFQKIRSQSWGDGSVDKSTCQVWRPEFDPRNLHGGEELNPASCGVHATHIHRFVVKYIHTLYTDTKQS